MSPPGSSTAPATRIQRKSANSSKWRGSFKSPQRHREEKTCSHRATAVRNGKKSSVTSVSLWCIFPRGEEKMQTPNTYRANSFRTGPDPRGHFGLYGGRYVAETLMPLILAVEAAYNAAKDDPNFHAELAYYLDHYVGRPSPLYFAERLTRHFGGAKLYLKRDELNHTGAHKINNVLGQVLLARRMGRRRIIAETGAGQHGVATATACAVFDLPCVVYMGATDIERQKPNVFRMKLLGAEVIPVHSGTAPLKHAMN